jgi:methionyl-tRNA formyltransferase
VTDRPAERPRAAFFGTPEAAVKSLDALTGVADVALIVTRTDKPRGRSGSEQPSPVKQRALELNIPVAQPASSNEIATILHSVGSLDVAVVTAFGMIIGADDLAIPKHRFLNVHFSLLPRWRGASPVAAAIAAGDEETGVVIMVVDPGLDTGPILAASSAVIDRDENAGALTSRLAVAGAGLLAEILPLYLDNKIQPIQQGTGATVAARIKKAQTFLDLQQPAEVLARWVRALSPRPGAHLFLDGRRFRIAAARPLESPALIGRVTIEDDRLVIGTGEAMLEVLRIQPAGKPEMATVDWLRGLRSHPTKAS